jgi:hypothetical protein
MTVEQRLDQLEKRNKRLTVALTMTVVAMAAVVTLAATERKNGVFETVVARNVFVENDAGKVVVILTADGIGNGMVDTKSAKGKMLVTLNSLGGDKGTVSTYQANSKKAAGLAASDNGGVVYAFNKTDEFIAEMSADEYGNGLVGAYNRKGKGRTLQPGP